MRMPPKRIVAMCSERRSGVSRATLVLLSVLLAAAAGCNIIKAVGVQMAPTSEKVPPEFDRLAGKNVVIYVWAPPEVRWDYPKVRLDVAAYVGAYLKKNVKGVTLVDPARVESYLEQRNGEVDPADVGRQFLADMVLHLAVYQFSMRDVGMAHFYRGRISSSVLVYDCAGDGEAERIPLRDVAVAVPAESSVGYSNIRADQIRQMTYDAFAVEVGKKFHEWERPVE